MVADADNERVTAAPSILVLKWSEVQKIIRWIKLRWSKQSRCGTFSCVILRVALDQARPVLGKYDEGR